MSTDANHVPPSPLTSTPATTTSAATSQGVPLQNVLQKGGQGGTELSSILTQVQALQANRERLQKELEQSQGQIDKLQEGKRNDMQKILDTVIAKWLADSVENTETRKLFVEGMDRLVKGTKEDNGIWQVACQASHAHARRLEELEQLRVECNTLKEQAPGSRFKDENSRKRERDESASGGKSDDIWSSFEYKGLQ